MNFKLFILKLFAKNLDDILAIFTKLDAQLDAYILKEAAKKDQIEAQIQALQSQSRDSASNISRASTTQTKVRDLAGLH